MDLANKKIIITGAHGFLGKYIVANLIEQHCLKQQQLIQNHKRFSPDLQSMTEENPALLSLIDRLELEEIIT